MPQLQLLEFSLFPKNLKLLPSNFQANIPQSKREHARQQELWNKTGGLGETEQRKRGIGQEVKGVKGQGRREIGKEGQGVKGHGRI